MTQQERNAQGWDIFHSNQSSKDGKYCLQIQRLDEIGDGNPPLLKDDNEAKELAIKAGYLVGTVNNPFEVKVCPESIKIEKLNTLVGQPLTS